MGTDDGEQIGGLVKGDPETQKTNTSSLGQAPKSDSGGSGGGSSGGSSGGGSGLDGLDIFSQEEAGDDEENRLAASLPEIDIQDLLNECKTVAAELAKGMGES